MRALKAIRLSRTRDESTSVERQHEVVNRWSQANDHPIVGEAIDLDVSGAVNPFERDKLGSWLTDEPPEQWDVLTAWRLDRVSRSALDTLNLVEWLGERGKHLVTVSDGIDTSTDMGRVFVVLAAVFAQVEREATRDRVLASRATLRDLGRWGGGAVHYGLMPVELIEGGWVLDRDPVAALTTEQMAEWVLAGVSIAEVARRLTAAGALAPRDRQRDLRGKDVRGSEWAESTVMQLLRSRVLVGEVRHEGAVIGESPEIISPSEFQRVQAELDRRSRTKTRNPKANSAPLSGVAVCGTCFKPMYFRAQPHRSGRTYRYYYCHDKHTGQLRAGELEDLALESFLRLMGSSEVFERVVEPATDHADALARAQLGYDDAGALLGVETSEYGRQKLRERIRVLGTRIAELEMLPSSPGGVSWQPTGRTWTEELEQLDDDQRRARWISTGFRLAVIKGPGGHLRYAVQLPGDVEGVYADIELLKPRTSLDRAQP